MNVTYRLAPGPQFEFIEVTEDVVQDFGLIAFHYWELHKAVAENNKELPQKEWNRIVDNYLNGGSFENGEHEQMSDRQKWFIHEIDKSFNRLKAKE